MNNIPLRTLEDVRSALGQARKRGADKAMAKLMLNHGRLTEDARDFIVREYLTIDKGGQYD